MTSESPVAAPVSKPSPAAPPVAPVKGSDWWLMVKAFFRHGTKVASVAPSSRQMARTLMKGINWDTCKCLVELGGGTGPVTAELVKKLKPHTKLLVIELDPTLCGRLRERFAHFSNVDVILGDAAKFADYMAERGIPHVDHVLSELPLPSFSHESRTAIFEASAKTLAPHGMFRQLTLMPMIYYRLYCRYFKDVEFRFVPWNIPPGGVYVCRGYRGTAATA